MNQPQDDEMIEAGVYDSSRGTSRSNWQWGNVRIDEAWEQVAALIHQGWPATQREFPDQQAVLLGVIRRSECVWLYRVYPAGRDELGRPGRYFFLVMRLPSLEWISHPQVAALLAYFEKEREFPLNIKPLEKRLPDAEPGPVLIQLQKEFQEKSLRSHWGMDGTGRAIKLLDLDTEKKEPDRFQLTTVRALSYLGAGLVFAGAVVAPLRKTPCPGVTPDNDGDTKATPSLPPTVDSQPMPPEANPNAESTEPQADKPTPSEVPVLVPPPIPDDGAPSDLKPIDSKSDSSIHGQREETPPRSSTESTLFPEPP